MPLFHQTKIKLQIADFVTNGTGHPSSFTCPCRDWHRGLPRRSRLRGGAGSHVEEARPLGHALVHSTNSSAHAPCVAGSAPDSDAAGTCGGKCPGSKISKSNTRAGPEPLHVRQPDAPLPSGANTHGPVSFSKAATFTRSTFCSIYGHYSLRISSKAVVLIRCVIAFIFIR